MKSALEKTALILIQYLGPVIIRLYWMTLKVKRHNYKGFLEVKKTSNWIFALSHGRMFVPVWLHRRDGITTLVSQSKDGEMVARLVKGIGHKTVRGSSHRGAVGGLKSIIKAGRQGPVAMMIDGPRGPIDEPKIGSIAIARATQSPIIPITCSCDNPIIFSSWDKFLLPKPFSTVLMSYGEPIAVPKRANEEEMEEIRNNLKKSLMDLRADADKMMMRNWK